MPEKKAAKAKSPGKKSPMSTETSGGSNQNASVNSNTTFAASTQPVSTSDMVAGTSRNSVIEGAETMNIDDVRRRAYELYEERGGIPGNDADDWLRAEQELRSRRNGGRGSDGKKSA
jgi:hypothetical protein